MDNAIKVYTSYQPTIAEFTISGIGEQERRYYQLIINTTTGDSISSPITCGSSYQKIVYHAFDENSKKNMELYVVDVDGENRIRLTYSWKDDTNPYFSPDGFQILYDSGREISVMDINGNHRKRLSYSFANDALPQFTPDGSQIVFLSQRDGNFDIFKMNADGTNPSNLTNTSYHEYYFRVSPDGNQIIYQMDVNRWDIGLIGIDGSNFKHLTSDSTENYHPEFSPDGLKVVYESRNQSVTDLILMNIADTSKINLTENFNYVTKEPKFSPDGNKIIFHSTYGVYLINVDGSNVTHLVDNIRVYSAQFSPDGSKIVFTANNNIFLINVDGSSLIQLTEDADLLNQSPIFQPIP